MSLMTRRNKVRQAYFDWLCNLIDRRGQDLEARELATELHHKEFRSHVENDDNRVADALQLRSEYVRKYSDEFFGDLTDQLLNDVVGHCTMLELMIAIARHMDYILTALNEGDQTAKWFWQLARNMGLQTYSCDDPTRNQKRTINDEILDTIIGRRYDENGVGGMFPLHKPPCDQRDCELWNQMNYWISENF